MFILECCEKPNKLEQQKHSTELQESLQYMWVGEMNTTIFEGKPYRILSGCPDIIYNQALERITWKEYFYSKTLYHIFG